MSSMLLTRLIQYRYIRLLLIIGIAIRRSRCFTSPSLPALSLLHHQRNPFFFRAASSLIIPLARSPRMASTPSKTQRSRSQQAFLSAVPGQILIIVANDDDDNSEENVLKSAISGDDEDDDDDEEEMDDDSTDDRYQTVAASEFVDIIPSSSSASKSIVSSSSSSDTSSSSALATPTTTTDWGGALGKLRLRMEDMESGKSREPTQLLFRLMSSQTPSQQISNFVSNAKPEVVTAMSSAIASLLGGLSSTPMSGFDTIVKASGEKLGSLCFQLQMTGYMFRNAEYLMAIKSLMNIKGSATLDDYRSAFDEIDADGSGYIESNEIRTLLESVYDDGKVPGFEVSAFLTFFDKNKDGRISWNEFEQGLGRALAQQNQESNKLKLLGGYDDTSDGDDEEDISLIEPRIEGTVEVELEDGRTIEIEASSYMDSLKQEVRALKSSLRREKGLPEKMPIPLPPGVGLDTSDDSFAGIADYISRRQGDLKSLTEGISPDIVTTMKMLVDFVMNGGDSGKFGKNKPKKEELEIELPASALQQLALWQLILGYRLREAEGKGDYLRLLE